MQSGERKEKVLSTQSSSKSPIIIAVMALLLTFAALAGVAYLWNESRLAKEARVSAGSEQNTISSKLDSQVSTLGGVQNSVESLQSELQSTRESVEKAQSGNQALYDRMATLEARLAEMSGAQRIDWMLKEVEHFVMVAEQRLSLLGDANGALALLQEADQLVREMADPATRELRKSLQQDIYQLKEASSASVDTEGLFNRLSNLINRVSELTVAATSFEMNYNEPDSVANDNSPYSGLSQFWVQIQEFVNSLVRVERIDSSEIKPLMLGDQKTFIEQNLQLLLEQAQLALLRGNQSVYDASLSATKGRIEEYLRTNNSSAETFLKELQELKGQAISAELPSIGGSIRAVQVFRDFWNQEKVERQLSRAALANANKQPASQPDSAENTSDSQDQKPAAAE